jgi:hypothetical protein
MKVLRIARIAAVPEAQTREETLGTLEERAGNGKGYPVRDG